MTKHKIDRASYHGGDLDGKNVIVMFNNNDNLFTDVKKELKKIPANKRCTDNEIDDMVKRYFEISNRDPASLLISVLIETVLLQSITQANDKHRHK